MTKINNKGFVLAEMLIVTVFLMVIFSMLYANFYPILAEYEIREGYDDVDSKYAVYWVKKLIEDASYTFDGSSLTDSNTYLMFNCSGVSTENEKQNTCKALVNKLEIANCNANGDNCNIYITKYQISEFKNTVKTSNSFTSEFKSYINTLPDFKTPSLNNAKYRVIVIFNHNIQKAEVNGGKYTSYATIEVRK